MTEETQQSRRHFVTSLMGGSVDGSLVLALLHGYFNGNKEGEIGEYTRQPSQHIAGQLSELRADRRPARHPAALNTQPLG